MAAGAQEIERWRQALLNEPENCTRILQKIALPRYDNRDPFHTTPLTATSDTLASDQGWWLSECGLFARGVGVLTNRMIIVQHHGQFRGPESVSGTLCRRFATYSWALGPGLDCCRAFAVNQAEAWKYIGQGQRQQLSSHRWGDIILRGRGAFKPGPRLKKALLTKTLAKLDRAHDGVPHQRRKVGDHFEVCIMRRGGGGPRLQFLGSFSDGNLEHQRAQRSCGSHEFWVNALMRGLKGLLPYRLTGHWGRYNTANCSQWEPLFKDFTGHIHCYAFFFYSFEGQ